MLSSKDRSILKSAANGIPDTQLGKGAISDNFLKSVRDSLLAHEIVKVSVLKNAGSPLDFAYETARLVDAEVVTIIGSKFILYKKSPRLSTHLLGEQKKVVKNTSTGKRLGGKGTKYADRQSTPLYEDRPQARAGANGTASSRTGRNNGVGKNSKPNARGASHGVSRSTARGIEGRAHHQPAHRGKRRTDETGRV